MRISIFVCWLVSFLNIGSSDIYATDSTQGNTIRVVCTSALINHAYAMRKQEYISSIHILKDFGYQPFIFEACQMGPPSFEEYTPNVFYSNVNDYSLRNKGVNEAMSLIAGFSHYTFDDNDMIVKLTGRYRFNSRYFLTIVEKNPHFDAFIKIGPTVLLYEGRAFTGCYAMRYKFFKHMLENLNLREMEERMIDFETVVGNYVNMLNEQGYPVMYLENLDVTANIGGGFPPALTQW
jgi:hypothetical protein